ncbi:MAG TPA: sigma-70 family RNA polymerase sigma factor [Puia sp.]|jgi:RNA polymerase sigma-70 factor (ECF subfamily)|nr:sigma-70 family RNA polymerase sigma factor [Puia sp.]
METAYIRPPVTDQPDLSVFDGLYHQYHHAVYSNIRKLIRQEEAAEDILQEVFIALWENRKKLDSARVAGWLFVTSYNKSIKYLKRKQRESAIPLVDELLHNSIAEEEANSEEWHRFRVSMIEDAVNHLPERKKQVFRLCRYEGKSCDEVARIMDISPTSVRDYLKQSNRFIKEYIFSNYTELSLSVVPLLIIYLGQ